MIDTAQLRLGNLITWNPAIAHPASTLSPLLVEVAAISATEVGYVPVNIGHRVEPFEDDLIQQEPIFRNNTEFEPVALTPELISLLNPQQLSHEHWRKALSEVSFLHQYQNLYFLLTGEEADLVDFPIIVKK